MSTQGAPSQLRPGTWNVDAVHSQVMVSVRHMSVTSLRAKFPRVSGKLEVREDDPLHSSFDVEIDTRSVTTGHQAQEDFMRSEPWLDAEHHPSISFQSTSITPSPDGFLIGGDLTLKGVTRSIQIPAVFHGVVADPWGLRAGFTSSVTVDRRDFGISWNRAFDWGVMASEEMEISLDIELAYPDESLAQKPRE
ncbi:MAG: YceI family protein [bacterium]|jgi:polyisoprenoid-binding protein YceI|nr:YceI family protein [bacterium]